jgi:predicted GIY-YIG superfamily endonuclease
MSALAEPWFVYLVSCGDGSLYTGIARDVARRVEVHNRGRGARYTRGRLPVALLLHRGPMTRSEALRLEARLKRLPRGEKRGALEAWAAAVDPPVGGC